MDTLWVMHKFSIDNFKTWSLSTYKNIPKIRFEINLLF